MSRNISNEDLRLLKALFEKNEFQSSEFKDLEEKYSKKLLQELYRDWKKIRGYTAQFWRGRTRPSQLEEPEVPKQEEKKETETTRSKDLDQWKGLFE